jgi:predicted O-methyltransferase YrrM
MSFTVTEKWLFDNYGSSQSGQLQQTLEWLFRFGKNVPPAKFHEWSRWKHLSEYQPNTPTIVEDCLAMIGKEFETELEVHRQVNLLRVPIAIGYEDACNRYQPKSILELGVGGDSAISTAVHLRHAEKVGGSLLSVDLNPLGMTWERYKKFPFWMFQQGDSVTYLMRCFQSSLQFDMIFIDTIHSYVHTFRELNISSKMTSVIVMDDITFPGNSFDDIPGGVKRAIEEWGNLNTEWKFEKVQESVGVFTK